MSEADAGPADVVVAGGGAAGLIGALALAGAGLAVTLVAPTRRVDRRATALMHGSVQALDALGVWTRLAESASPLRTMRIVDDTRRLIRAPEVAFEAHETGLDAFAWNIENEPLLAVLEEAVAASPGIRRVTRPVVDLAPGTDDATLRLDDGSAISAALVVAADGRNSLLRERIGIRTRSRSYPQVAVTATLSHERPHHDISTEFHTETGPFTLVPLPGPRSNIVCVVDPREAERLGRLDDADFARAMERRAHSILGRMTVETRRSAYPLGAQTAERFGARRVALIGEAAHTIPPIGAQGLNLGIRDVATLAELVVQARRRGQDIGADAVLDAYEARRRSDVESRTLAVDLLNRSLLTGFLPAQAARGFGLWLMDRLPPLRQAIMRRGVGPTRDVPRLLLGEPL
ncbi:UbiH/UbiF family hydroxylase [Ancylobacter terrae]|uniref:UbiH/UbiF family hydroxylase n=1 Tax=Ancylobacter sp. sgz301288 TaxID=3342077 RepID=UPI00385C4ABD